MAMQQPTALFNRALHADGFKPDRDYWQKLGTAVAITSVSDVLGKATHYTNNPDRVVWESLLTREIIISGGL